jgi:hemoglobin/transferrin/lactoferrin receptor protein
MKRWVVTGISVLACAAATPAIAQDGVQGATTQDEVRDDSRITVTATRQPVATVDAPVTVTVIDDRRIADELATDIKDLVRFEPGVTVPRSPTRFGAALGVTGRAGNEGFVIRGIGGNRVLMQIDGVRVPDGFTFGAQAAGRGDYVDVGLIKSVEILRGPASALYGSDGLAGAVSFVTSNPVDFLQNGNSIGGLVRAAYSSADNEFSETAILAGRSGDWSAMLAYTRRDFQELDNKGAVGGIGSARTEPNPQDGRSNAVLGRVVYDGPSGNRFRLTGEYLDTYLFTDVLTGLGQPTAPSRVDLLQARDTGKRGRIAGDWTWAGEGTFDYARISAYWQNADDRQFTDEDRTPAADRERLNTFENNVYGASVELRAGFATAGLAHRVVIGGDISRTHQEGLRDGVVPPAGEVFPTRAFPETDYTLAGAFIADEIALGPITFYPALRFDAYDLSPDNDPLLPSFAGAAQSGSRVSPKLGAVLKTDGGVRLFANYAQGFKAPEPSQVNQFFENLAFGYTSRPNPNLRPETSESIEAGLRYEGHGIRADLTAFHSDYDGFISQEVVSGGFTPADPAIYQFINLDKVEVKGMEARFEGNVGGFTGRVSLAYAEGDVIDPSGARSPLSTVDPFKLVVGAGYRDADGRFGGQLIATHSAQKDVEATTGICTGACYRPGAFTLLDATAFVRLTQGLTLRAGVFNIFDRKYAWWNDVRGLADSSAVKDAYTQPGRNGSVSLSFRF